MAHPDFQNIVEWDGPALDSNANAGAGGVGPIVPCGEWAASRLFAKITGANTLVEIGLDWFMDRAGTQLVASRDILHDVALNGTLSATLTNLGPFVRVTTVRQAGAGANSYTLFGTNRVPPQGETTPRGPVLMTTAPAVGAGATSTSFPTVYWAGPVMIWWQPGAQPGFLFVDYAEPTTGAYSSFFVRSLAGGAFETVTAVVPLGAWRVRLNNTSGAASNMDCIITPASTGST